MQTFSFNSEFNKPGHEAPPTASDITGLKPAECANPPPNSIDQSRSSIVCIDPYGSAAQAVQTQLVGELADPHGVREILFVGEH